MNYVCKCVPYVCVPNFSEKLDPSSLLEKNSVFGYYSGTNTEPNRGLLINSNNIRIGFNRASSNQAGIHALTEHDFAISKSSLDSA